MSAPEPQEGPAAPLRIVSGNPTAEQAAVLVAVLSAIGDGPGESEAVPPPRSLWSDHERAVRSHPSPGPGAWRASALPRG